MPKNSGPRFFVTGDTGPVGACLSDPPDIALGQLVSLDKDQSRHAQRVLRLGVDDGVQLMDGRGRLARATIADAGAGRVTCRVDSVVQAERVCPQITVATAIPKGPRGDAMANDLAQLGVDTLVPLQTARSVVHPGEGKLGRYRKASAEAGKQCGRAWFMEVDGLMGFDEALARYAATPLKLLADPAGEPTAGVASRIADAESVVVLVGPEGGFTSEEATAACDAGFVPWRYAPHILRVETAAAAAVAVLRALA